jgi:hypothetical protein
LATPALLAVLWGVMVFAAAAVRISLAVFTSSASDGGNVLAADTLAVPAGLTATGGTNIVLSWTATASTYAAGYHVLRGTATGGPYSQIAQVTPRSTVTYADSPSAGTYYYVVRAYFQNWESANSNEATAGVSANTGYLPCTANAPQAGGNADGYEVSPANACALDGLFAQDVNSGTSTSTSCTAPGKDKHRFYNYGFAIPASSVIDGIQVRLDARIAGTGTVPKLCVQLSWNGGANWTAAKSTATLTNTETTYILGATNDTWGRAWTVSQFSNANFRLRVIDVDNTTTQTFQLDFVAVQVTYTPP